MDACAQAGLLVLADKGYTGAGQPVHVPYKGRDLPPAYRDANSVHATLRGLAERAFAVLKSWRLLRRLRCCPQRATNLARAILVLTS